MRIVAIPVFEDVEELDFIGPYEVLSYVNKITPSLRVLLVSEQGGMVRAFNGLRFCADCSFEDCPSPDILVVPGGKGRAAAMKNPAMLTFVRKSAEKAKLVTSVCTGAFVLAEAGLLRGRRATTYHTALQELAQYPEVTVTGAKVEHDGAIITAAGVSSGLELGLYIIGEILGPDLASEVAQRIEYIPQPDTI